nr:hypothetical protein GCM10020093_087680 [Planobispora longispora]
MDRGDLVPDEVTIAMVRDRLSEDDAQDGFLLDGFPRNVPQAEILKKMLAEFGVVLDIVLELVVDEDEVVRRLAGRRTCSQCGRIWHVDFDDKKDDICDACGGSLYQRDDDKEETVRRRLEVYQEQTAPLITFYADEEILVGVDAAARWKRSPIARWRPWPLHRLAVRRLHRHATHGFPHGWRAVVRAGAGAQSGELCLKSPVLSPGVWTCSRRRDTGFKSRRLSSWRRCGPPAWWSAVLCSCSGRACSPA